MRKGLIAILLVLCLGSVALGGKIMGFRTLTAEMEKDAPVLEVPAEWGELVNVTTSTYASISGSSGSTEVYVFRAEDGTLRTVGVGSSGKAHLVLVIRRIEPTPTAGEED